MIVILHLYTQHDSLCMCDEIIRVVGASFAVLLLPDEVHFLSPAMTDAIFTGDSFLTLVEERTDHSSERYQLFLLPLAALPPYGVVILSIPCCSTFRSPNVTFTGNYSTKSKEQMMVSWTSQSPTLAILMQSWCICGEFCSLDRVSHS